jgi:hypothetical protein
MPKLTVGGTVITGVVDAKVHTFHRNPNAADNVPTIQFEVQLRLQNTDFLGKWALAKQSADRYKKVELQIMNRENTVANTWTMLNGYLADYQVIEHPPTGAVTTGTGEHGFYNELVIRGNMPEGQDYSGVNIATVAAGAAPKDA